MIPLQKKIQHLQVCKKVKLYLYIYIYITHSIFFFLTFTFNDNYIIMEYFFFF